MKQHPRVSKGDQIFEGVLYVLITLVVLVTLYPFIYLISVSISDPQAVLRGEIMVFPRGFTLGAFDVFFQDGTIWRAYLNTVCYAGIAAFLGVLISAMSGYVLSLDCFRYRRSLGVYFVITMFFSGGMIPSYIVMSKMRLVNTIVPLVLPGAASVWYMLIFRTFFQSDVSGSLRESALLDGASEYQVFLRIVLPLSKPVLATVCMYYIVGQWNSYFTPMIYLNKTEMYPLQMILQNKLAVSYAQKLDGDLAYQAYSKVPTESMRAAAILATMFPIMCSYPFLQKYFIKGVMIGAVKG